MFPDVYLQYISDAPVCTASTVVIAGASLEESISVPCRVIADPSDVTFEWTFTSSGERFEVPHGHHTTSVHQQQQQPNHQHHDSGSYDRDGRSSSSSTVIESNETHAESDGKFYNIIIYEVDYIYSVYIPICKKYIYSYIIRSYMFSSEQFLLYNRLGGKCCI